MSQHFYPSFFTPIGKGSSVADSTSSAWWAPADKTPLDYEEPAVVWACAFSFGHGVDLSTWKGKREEGRRTHSPVSSKYGLYELHVWHPCSIFSRGREYFQRLRSLKSFSNRIWQLGMVGASDSSLMGSAGKVVWIQDFYIYIYILSYKLWSCWLTFLLSL